MELKDQVCLFEQAERLQKLGVQQTAYWSFFRDAVIDDEFRLNKSDANCPACTLPKQKHENQYSAFTASEIAEFLPADSGVVCWDAYYNDHGGTWHCVIRKWVNHENIPPVLYESEEETLVAAMADTLIYYLESKK